MMERGKYTFSPNSTSIVFTPLVPEDARKDIIEALRTLEALKKKLKELLDK